MVSPQIVVTAANETSATPVKDILERCGGNVTLALPGAPDDAQAALQQATALMLGCGLDLAPALHRGTAEPHVGPELNRPGDTIEMTLLRHALDRDLPVLAICRGMQLINVAFGGTLLQDVPGHSGEEGEDGTWQPAYHTTYLSPGSKLAAILGSGGFMRLNSIHRQGLREAQKAPALLAIAYSVEDGIIEGLESPAHEWVIGVQCHPERKREVPGSFKRLFQAFVERAESRH